MKLLYQPIITQKFCPTSKRAQPVDSEWGYEGNIGGSVPPFNGMNRTRGNKQKILLERNGWSSNFRLRQINSFYVSFNIYFLNETAKEIHITFSK